MRPFNLLMLPWVIACVACVAAPEPADTTGETGELRECDEGLLLCCPDGAPSCEDEWGSPYDAQTTPNNQRWGCIDPTVSRYHCGGCANKCPTDQIYAEDVTPTSCSESLCSPTLGSTCMVAKDSLDCDQLCAFEGKACIPNGCYGSTMFIYGMENPDCNSDIGIANRLSLACDQPPPPEYTDGTAAMRCCCE